MLEYADFVFDSTVDSVDGKLHLLVKPDSQMLNLFTHSWYLTLVFFLSDLLTLDKIFYWFFEIVHFFFVGSFSELVEAFQLLQIH